MNIETLDFQLPDFTRVTWASAAAKHKWGVYLKKIRSVWRELEWRSVYTGVRACGLLSVNPKEFEELSPYWLRNGYASLILERQGMTSMYASTPVPLYQGDPFLYRVVIGKYHDVLSFQQAWEKRDSNKIGLLLGYPPCCRSFFSMIWEKQQRVDTTWAMACNSITNNSPTNIIEVSGNPESNILWRWMGARAVPHLPCSFNCQSTVMIARQWISLGCNLGHEPEMDWLLEILSWPVEWSALHGIAEIKTPILKVSTRTDATSQTLTVRYRGEKLPEETVSGLGYTYRSPRRFHEKTLPNLESTNNSDTHEEDLDKSWVYADNGFFSLEDMEHNHKQIVKYIVDIIDNRPASVLDLGCGNGQLLHSIQVSSQNVCPFGVDLDARKILHAKSIFPIHEENFHVGDLFEQDLSIWQDTCFDIVILMPGRLLEVSQEIRTSFLEHLRKHCKQIVLYAYGDWLTRYSSLSVLANLTGFQLKTKTKEIGVSLGFL